MSDAKRLKKVGETGKIADKLRRSRISVIGLINEKNWVSFVNPRVTGSGSRSFSSKYNVTGRQEFSAYSEQEKVDLFLSMEKKERMFRLEKCLRSRLVNVSQVRNIYKEFIGPPKKLSRDIIIKSIISKFNDEELDLDKRKNEKEIISEEDFVNLFVRLNGVEVPKDILVVIFSYLKYNSEFLFQNCGTVCKDFYITILTTWPYIFISKINLYSTSLLVIRSCQTIVFKSILSLSEIDFLFQNINPDRLHTISFYDDYSLNFIRLLFSVALKLKKKNTKNYVFSRVSKVFFHPRGRKDYTYIEYIVGGREKKKFDWKSIKMIDVFPSLQEVHHPPSISLLRDSSLKNLRINTHRGVYINRGGFIKHDTILDYSLIPLKVEEELFVKTNKLYICNRLSKNDENEFRTVLRRFQGIKHISIEEVGVVKERNENEETVLGFLRCFQDLVSLDIVIASMIASYSLDDKYFLNPSFPFLSNLKSFDICISNSMVKNNFVVDLFSKHPLIEIAKIELSVDHFHSKSQRTVLLENRKTLLNTIITQLFGNQIQCLVLKISFCNELFFVKFERMSRVLEFGSFLTVFEENLIYDKKGVAGRKLSFGETRYYLTPVLLGEVFKPSIVSFYFDSSIVDSLCLYTSESNEKIFLGKKIDDVVSQSFGTEYSLVEEKNDFDIFLHPQRICMQMFKKGRGIIGSGSTNYEYMNKNIGSNNYGKDKTGLIWKRVFQKL